MSEKISGMFNEFEQKKNEQAVGRRLICVRPLEGYTTYLGVYRIEKYLEETKRFVITDDSDKECHVRADRFLHVEQFGWWIRNHPIDEVQIMFFVNKMIHLMEQRDNAPNIVMVGDVHAPDFVKELEKINEKKCICPEPKNDGSPFDGVSYYCPIHGR